MDVNLEHCYRMEPTERSVCNMQQYKGCDGVAIWFSVPFHGDPVLNGLRDKLLKARVQKMFCTSHLIKGTAITTRIKPLSLLPTHLLLRRWRCELVSQ